MQYAGHINKTFWTIKIWLGRQVGCGTVKIWTKIALILPHIALYFKLPWPPLPTLSNLCGSKWRVDVSRIYVVCFKFNQLLRGSFRPQKSILAIIANFGYFWGLFLALSLGTSGSRNENLRPLFNTNISPISGKHGFKNHFWPLESVFLMSKSEKKGPNAWGTLLPILRLTFLESSCNFRKIGLKNDIFSNKTGLQDLCA